MRRIVQRGARCVTLALLGTILLAAGVSAEEAEKGRRPTDVRVINGPDQAVPVRNVEREVRQPFQRQFALDWQDGVDLAEAEYQVPAGKRLVVEYASFWAYLPPNGQTVFVRIVTSVSGSQAFHTIALQKREDYGVLKQFDGAHLVHLHADPGSTVRVSAGRLPFTGLANAGLTLSGYLVDVP